MALPKSQDRDVSSILGPLGKIIRAERAAKLDEQREPCCFQMSGCRERINHAYPRVLDVSLTFKARSLLYPVSHTQNSADHQLTITGISYSMLH